MAFEGFKRNEKAIIYTERIDTVKDLVDICFEQGLRVVWLWYKNNQNKTMDKINFILYNKKWRLVKNIWEKKWRMLLMINIKDH